MNAEEEDKKFQKQFNILALGILFLAIVSLFFDPRLWFACGALIVGWIVFSRRNWKRKMVRDRIIFEEIFGIENSTIPKLEISFSYGYINFTVTFRTEAEMKEAKNKGTIERFRATVQELYGHTGTKDRPFDVNMAVYETWEGRVYHFKEIPE